MATREPMALGMEAGIAGHDPENHFYVEAVSPAMRPIERVMADIGPTDVPVLLVGENGTGKDLVALHLHRISRRRERGFRKVHCGSVPPQALLSSTTSREVGTLYLDEVTELSADAQARLLQALAEAELSGAEHTARLICASTRSVEELMRAGWFREELYYRLNGVCLRLPPLRHRREDIPGLAEFFLARYSAMLGRPQPMLDAEQVTYLLEHSWPGNIRELEAAMKKVAARGESVACAVAQGTRTGSGLSPVSLKEASRAASRQAERELILRALARTRWNRKRAAMELRISYKALLYKLKQIGLEEAAGL